MIDPRTVRKQLRQVGADKAFWGKPELNELPKIMFEGEIIEHVRHGYYSGGFATLVATNHRLLLIDKKLFFLNLEDIRYDMIAEVDYGHQFFGSTVHIRSFSKDLKFQSMDKASLRQITSFIQHKVMQLRGQHSDHPSLPGAIQKQSIPMQVFSSSNDGLTDQQTNGLLPLSQETWYKHNPNRQIANPYKQTPLTTRRRVGRFDFANDR